jgi:DNA-binding NarL/FixJ family response regulator
MNLMPRVCSVLLVEDETGSFDELSQAIGDAQDLALAGSARTLAAGRKQLRQLRPDVLLTDLQLPDGNGIELIHLARAEGLARHILVLTMFAAHSVVMQCLRAGATGYLLKGDGSEDITAQVRHLRGGGRPISPLIARNLLDELVPRGQSPAGDLPLLSEQEQTVLQFCAKGCTYDEIARVMSLSRHTVETYIRRSFRKLQVHNKAEAIYEARRLGVPLG